MTDDYQYGDEYDWDREDPRQYCRHGSFIGSWWGPDIMCMKCELDYEDPTLNEMLSVFDDKIRKNKNSITSVYSFFNRSIKEQKMDKDSIKALLEFLMSYEESLNEEIESSKQSRQSVIDEYSQFSDDWDTDRDILYKAHRAQIDEYDNYIKNKAGSF